MQTIRALLIGKSIYCVPPTVSVLDAARTMCDRRIGAIVVRDGVTPVGVFSERDLMERVVVRGKDPARVPVSEVMTRDIITASPDESPVECMRKMQERGCRHLPIVEADGKPTGSIAIQGRLPPIVPHSPLITVGARRKCRDASRKGSSTRTTFAIPSNSRSTFMSSPLTWPVTLKSVRPPALLRATS